MIVETDFGIPMPRMVRQLPMSDRLKEWLQSVASAHGSTGNLSGTDSHDLPPEPMVLDFTPEAIALLDRITRGIHEYRNRHKDSPLSAMKSRVREIIMRLSLVAAVSQGEAAISEGSLSWAHEFVTFYSDRVIALMERSLSVNDFHHVCNATWQVIRQSGLRGASERELCRSVAKLRGLKPREREDVFRALMSDYGITKIQRQQARGRPALVWIAPGDDDGE